MVSSFACTQVAGPPTALQQWARTAVGQEAVRVDGGVAPSEVSRLSEERASSPELGSLASLDYLKLYNNQLSGTVPPELGSLAVVSSLLLHNNALAGPVPQPELAERSAALQHPRVWPNTT